MATETTLDIQVITGYPFIVRPINDDPGIAVDEDASGPARPYGFHGDGIPPSNGEWIADFGEYGAVVVIDDPDELSIIDTWTVEAADLDEDWSYGDESWRVVCVREGRHPGPRGYAGSEWAFAGYTR